MMADWILMGLIAMAIGSMAGVRGHGDDKNVWYPCLTPSCEEFMKDTMGPGAATGVNATRSADNRGDDLSIVDVPALAHLHVQGFDHQAKAFPARKMKICDNFVTRDVTAKVGRSGVRKSILALIKWMQENPMSDIAPFSGAWRAEVARVLGPTMKMKYFCINNTAEAEVAEGDANACSVFSIGSNNIWDFEEAAFAGTPCNIHAFDCTVGHNARPPKDIKSRTKLHRACLAKGGKGSGPSSSSSSPSSSSLSPSPPSIDDFMYQVTPESIGFDLSITSSGQNDAMLNFTTLPGLNILADAPKGATYFKLDIEGYEWGILRGMVRWASAHAAKGDGAYARPHSGARDVELPKQIFGEFHLDRDVSEQNKYSMVPPDKAHVGQRLRHFLDEMFIRGGYMVMFSRETVQTRNADMLMVKVLCDMDA